MTLATLLTRLHGAYLVIIGRVQLPDVPLSQMELAMAWDNTKLSIQRVQDALTRASADKAKTASDLTTAQQAEAAAEQSLSDADAEIVQLLDPVVTAAETLSPPPPAGQ